MLRECVLHPYKYYILATSPHILEDHLVLKDGDCFAVFNRYGDIVPEGLGEEGIYYQGTRFLSRLEFTLCDTRPFLLGSAVRGDNLLLVTDMTNPDIFLDEELLLPRGSLHIHRSKLLFEGGYYEQIKIQSYANLEVRLPFSILFDGDFADIFEVRGVKREKRGKRLQDMVRGDRVLLRYRGLDGVHRETVLSFMPQPVELGPKWAVFHLHLKPKEMVTILLTVFCNGGDHGKGLSYRKALLKARQALKELRRDTCSVRTSNERFNAWLDRSYSDVFMMLTPTPHGLYPYGGIPWFNAIFGRDGIITALEFLWINPSIARGVLAYLAATQAQDEDPKEDAEPGKIIHEIRQGEMAATGEIPFRRYYGSVDATPLFIVLAGSYYERTGDREFIWEIWGPIKLALQWMDRYGDRDGDDFLEYVPSPNGLVNKGWKDSHDSVFHSDGTLAFPPIALVEVQGYAYLAKVKGAMLAEAFGEEGLAQRLREEAYKLRERFLKAFWDEKLGTYVLALDGKKNPCRVKASNPGHTLFSGIALRNHAKAIVCNLLGKDLFSGWGIRTLSTQEALYNPVSYHNGSVWPHDNALIAWGLSKYGLREELLKIVRGIFEASTFFPFHRLPELFCGFSRRPNEGPISYPVACNPQAWASASVFMILQACLGMAFDGDRLFLRHPILPPFMDEVHINGLEVGDTKVDLLLKRYQNDVVVNVLEKREDVEILITK